MMSPTRLLIAISALTLFQRPAFSDDLRDSIDQRIEFAWKANSVDAVGNILSAGMFQVRRS
jgi:hypothetical protein